VKTVFKLALILTVSFLIKIPVLTAPLTGHFGSYQAMNAMMSEMIRLDSIRTILIPRVFLLMDGKPALHLLYYPFASFFVAVAKFFFGGGTDFLGRFQAAFFVALAGAFLYPVARSFLERRAALLAVLIFSFSPMTLVSGVSFQNEAIAIFFLMASFWVGLFSSAPAAFFSGILFSLALVARLHFLFVAPAFFALFFLEENSWKRALMFCFGSALPVTAWFGFTYFLERNHEGFVMTSLFRQAGAGGIFYYPLFLKGVFYKRIFEILLELCFTPLLSPFLVFGLLLWDRKRLPFIAWVFGSLAAIVLLPQKVFDHPFYLIAMVPSAAILMAPVLESFLSRFGKVTVSVFFVILFAVLLRYYVPPAFSGFGPDGKVREMGRFVASITDKGDRIVASHGTSPDLLYYSGREGWTFDLKMARHCSEGLVKQQKLLDEGYGDPIVWLEKLRRDGGSFLVVSEPGVFRKQKAFFAYVNRSYKKIPAPNESFEIFDVRQVIT